MPIDYSVSDNGNFITALAVPPVTAQEFVDYEIAHAIDERIKQPVAELFEIKKGALQNITKTDIKAVLERRREIKEPPTVHRCGLVVTSGDAHDWDIAKFYEGMTLLHFPEVVIVFGDLRTAKIWLGMLEE